MKLLRRWILAAGAAALLTLPATAALLTSPATAAEAATASSATPVSQIPCTSCRPLGAEIVFTPLPGTTGAGFDCFVGPPLISDDSPWVSWVAVTRCTGANGTGISGTAVHMDGYTAFYQWGSELALTLGTAYDVTTTTYGESTGGPILPPFADLQWGVNHNVLIDIPAGYIAALPSGCFLPDTSQVECTNTTGPFTI